MAIALGAALVVSACAPTSEAGRGRTPVAWTPPAAQSETGSPLPPPSPTPAAAAATVEAGSLAVTASPALDQGGLLRPPLLAQTPTPPIVAAVPSVRPTATVTPAPKLRRLPQPRPQEGNGGVLAAIKGGAGGVISKIVPDWGGSERVNILLLGVDKQDTTVGNTDVMMLASIDPATRSAVLLSIPRDLCLNECKTYRDRINAIYRYEGLDALKEKVGGMLDLRVDYYALVNFNGFADAIDLLGGIDIWAERDFDELFEFLETREQLRLYMERGWNHVDGRRALLLARSRQFDSRGDYDRICRQQQIVRELRNKVTSLEIVPQVPLLLSGLGEWFHTDFPLLSIPSFAELVSSIPRGRVHSFVITPWDDLSDYVVGEDGAGMMQPDVDRIRDFVLRAFLESAAEPGGQATGYCQSPP